MKRKTVLLGVAAVMAVGCGIALSKSINIVQEERDATIILQLKADVKEKNAAQIKASQDNVLARIRTGVTNNIEVVDRFSNAINAITLKVNAKYVTQIRNVQGVKTVEYDNFTVVEYTDNEMVSVRANVIDVETENISKGTMDIPSDNNGGEGTTIAILDSSFMVNATYTDDDGVKWTNVTHAAYTDLDENVSIKFTQNSIQDIISNNPSFHGKRDATHSTYLNRKVPFYYDYGGDLGLDADDDTEPQEDYNVFTIGSDHGNHVASIAGGNDPLYKGIAPKAQLLLMKVFTVQQVSGGYSVGARDTCLIKAFEDCAILGVDVINMSLGSALNDILCEGSASSEALANLKAKGTEIAIAAGNEGKDTFYNSAYQYWTTDMVEGGILGHYAVDNSATVIASGQPDKQYYETAFKVGNNIVAFRDQIENYTDSDGNPVEYKPERHLVDLLVDHPDGNFDWILIPGWGEKKDYTDNNITKDDVTGKIAIIHRGEITFQEKIYYATQYGAIAVGIIDNDPTQTSFNFRMAGLDEKTLVPVFSILYKDKTVFEDATDFTCQLYTDKVEVNPNGRTISDFSSDGPSFDLSIKPEITTPGSEILGAVYANGPASYDYYSGTSMATPNYAGAYALALGEHLDDETWRNTLTDRLMSSAKPMVDRYGDNLESVRKQGAGLLNMEAALNTEVILDGSNTADELLGKAKIELGNNESIKNGKINLTFTTINYSEETISYDAKLSVYRPLTREGALDEEVYGQIMHDATLMDNIVELVKEAYFKVDVTPGQNLVNLRTELDADTIEELNGLFEYGCYLEGFVELSADGKEDLSIPYLGFFGDYESGIPVEPFKFERDANKLYPSDLLNSVATKWGGKNGADYGSDWVMGNWDNLENLSLTNYIKNDTYLRDILDGNKKKVVPVGTNPYTGEIETTDIYMGNNGNTNTMIIAQFIMRACSDNVLTITNKATGEVVLTDHMFDSFYGALEDEDGNDYQWPLMKSFVDVNYWSAGYIAHRAYTTIPLYNYTYDEDAPEGKKYNVGEPFADGEYEVKFNYTLASGGNYSKSYTLHIDSEGPQMRSMEDVTIDGEQYLRIRYDEIKFSYLSINGYKFDVKEDEQGYYIDISYSAYAAKDKVFVRSYDFAFSDSKLITHLSDANKMVLENNEFANNYDFEYELKDSGENEKELSFTYKKGSKATVLTSETKFSFNFPVPEGYELASISGKVNGSDLEIERNGNNIRFVGPADAKFIFNYELSEIIPTEPTEPTEPTIPSEPTEPTVPSEPSEPTTPTVPSEPTVPTVPSEPTTPSEPKKSGGCGGSIIAASASVSLISLLGICLLSIKKKHDNK